MENKCIRCSNLAIISKYCEDCKEKERLRYQTRKNSDEYKSIRSNNQKATRKYRQRHPERSRLANLNWAKKYPEKNRERVARRNARKLNATIEKVDYLKILERDGYWCYLCHSDVNPSAFPKTPEYISFDHVIPLCRGGSHSEANIRVTHMGCNSAKGGR